MLFCGMSIMSSKQFKSWKVSAVVGSIIVVGVLTYCTLLHFESDLKDAQINLQQSLIWKLILYEFELGHNTVESTKNICCMKGEGVVDHTRVKQMV